MDTQVVAFIVGAVVGLAVGWLLAQSRAAAPLAAERARLEERDAEVKRLQAEAKRLEDELAVKEEALQKVRAEVGTLREEGARLTTELEQQRLAAAEKLAVLAQAEKQFREAFQALSAEALRNNNQSFLQLARTALEQHQQAATSELEKRRTAIDGLVKPISEALQRVDAKLHEVEQNRVQSSATLSERLAALASAHLSLQAETANLSRALRAPVVRGRWGEIQLQRVVELAGMLEHCDFEQQVNTDGDRGRLKPDLVVRLPGRRCVVVDAKTPLEAYLDSIETTDDALRDENLRRHAAHVRSHMAQLTGKAYWDQFPEAPEFVVMFLPGETFFSAALQVDPSLIDFGVERRVILATPTTLIALLRAVAYGWQQASLAENARKIQELGRDLYERLCVMTEHFDALRKGLNSALVAHNRAVGSLERRVLPAARRFREMGISSSREVPELQPIDEVADALQAQELNALPAPQGEDALAIPG